MFTVYNPNTRSYIATDLWYEFSVANSFHISGISALPDDRFGRKWLGGVMSGCLFTPRQFYKHKRSNQYFLALGFRKWVTRALPAAAEVVNGQDPCLKSLGLNNWTVIPMNINGLNGIGLWVGQLPLACPLSVSDQHCSTENDPNSLSYSTLLDPY